jgi:very-short-patch-repair endonuclease
MEGDMAKGPRPHWRSPEKIQARARRLRSDPTDPERRLWRRLRGVQVSGAHFRRQHAIGNFIVDFFCARARLVVEVDGDTHAMAEDHDRARSRWLEGRGYTVLRFTNREVIHQLDAVVERIAEEVSKPLP